MPSATANGGAVDAPADRAMGEGGAGGVFSLDRRQKIGQIDWRNASQERMHGMAKS